MIPKYNAVFIQELYQKRQKFRDDKFNCSKRHRSVMLPHHGPWEHHLYTQESLSYHFLGLIPVGWLAGLVYVSGCHCLPVGPLPVGDRIFISPAQPGWFFGKSGTVF